MIIKKRNKNIIYSILLLSSILLFSCKSNNMIFKPNYDINSKYNIMKRPSIKIVKVYDNRDNAELYSGKKIGYVLSGLTNKKTPYFMDETLSDFVLKYVNKIIDSSNSENYYVPITITIETFKVYEVYDSYKYTGYAYCELNFSFPVSQDSFNIIYTNSNKEISSNSNVTNLIDIIIYDAILNCIKNFTNQYDNSNKYFIKYDDEINKYTNKVEKPNVLKIEFDTTINSEKKKLYSLTLNKLIGKQLKSSYNFYVSSCEYKEGQQIFPGISYGFIFFNVENTENNVYFYGLISNYAIKYFAFESLHGPFFKGGFSILYGWENIEKNTNFFIGPLFEENAGIKLGPFLVEAGLYQVFLFGSDALPQDFGYSLGIGLQF